MRHICKYFLQIDGEIDVTIPLSRIANEYDPNTFVPLLSKLAGHQLTIDAIVTESINGQVRHGYGDTQFYDAPFMLKFTDDHLTYFKPGLPYRASVSVDIMMCHYITYEHCSLE